jgi:putative acyl-CoA dehydrogenase
LFDELGLARGAHALLDPFVAALARDLRDLQQREYRARSLVERMALALQAALLLQHAPDDVGDAFCRSRLADTGGLNYGTLPTGVNVVALIDRATPRLA